jgi:hypothetical protein
LIDKIEIVKRTKVRRSKLYYIREKVAREARRQLRRMQMTDIGTVSEMEQAAQAEARAAEEAARAETEAKQAEEAAQAEATPAEQTPEEAAPAEATTEANEEKKSE